MFVDIDIMLASRLAMIQIEPVMTKRMIHPDLVAKMAG
jgi:hypothetical protein